MSGERVLVVEDDRAIADLLRTYLDGAGFHVRSCADGAEALVEVDRFTPAVVLLDLTLPSLDGLDVLRRLRECGDHTPVLLVTARDDEVDRVLGLELGADDYVTKPFSPRELLARVRAVLRRAAPPGLGAPGAPGAPAALPVPADPSLRPVHVGAVTVDPAARRVVVAGREVAFTTTEFDLLLHLCRQAGRVCSRGSLLHEVWGYPPGLVTRTVDVHVAQLRAKLDGALVVDTVRGVGYRLAVPGAGPAAATGTAEGT